MDVYCAQERCADRCWVLLQALGWCPLNTAADHEQDPGLVSARAECDHHQRQGGRLSQQHALRPRLGISPGAAPSPPPVPRHAPGFPTPGSPRTCLHRPRTRTRSRSACCSPLLLLLRILRPCTTGRARRETQNRQAPCFLTERPARSRREGGEVNGHARLLQVARTAPVSHSRRTARV